ncbi:glutathione S-transferase family protein [Zavarzinia sp. CC-PAN008]|uniref:glutathione S-transferase family protein n=1 Tax=Zavarzinia sp. CC-PAN008 TaxID=3243332 RepID=UPI003F743CB5
MLLYEHPLSPYAQKVKISLREKGVPFEVALPMAIGSGQTAGEFAAANPRGEVPVLIDGDARIFDSTIILEYIEDKHPTPAMLPRDPLARAEARMIEDVMDTHYEAINWGLGEIRFFRRAEGALADRLHAAAQEQTSRLQLWLEEKLAGRTWFNGDSFGWADLSVAPFVAMSAMFGYGPAEGSALAAWLARAAARPTVAQAFAEAQASVAGMVDVAAVLESGAFKREFRDHRLEWIIKSGGIDVVLEGLRRDNIRFTGHFA